MLKIFLPWDSKNKPPNNRHKQRLQLLKVQQINGLAQMDMKLPGNSVPNAVRQNLLRIVGPVLVALSTRANSAQIAANRNLKPSANTVAATVAGSLKIHTIHQNSALNVVMFLMNMTLFKTFFSIS